jgi:hypothetical protein
LCAAEDALDFPQCTRWRVPEHARLRELRARDRRVQSYELRRCVSNGVQMTPNRHGVSTSHGPRQCLRHAEPRDVFGDAAQERTEHQRYGATRNTGRYQQSGTCAGERCAAVRNQAGRCVIPRSVEPRQPARQHAERTSQAAGAQNGDAVPHDQHVCPGQGRRSRCGRERQHRVRLADSRNALAQRRQHLWPQRTCDVDHRRAPAERACQCQRGCR